MGILPDRTRNAFGLLLAGRLWGEAFDTAKKRNAARDLRARTRALTGLGLDRLEAILSDGETSNADVFKCVSLVFERANKEAPEADIGSGDVEIRLKEE